MAQHVPIAGSPRPAARSPLAAFRSPPAALRSPPAALRFPLAALAALLALAASSPALADTGQEACKKAMNDRIQVCTDQCTKTALAAASAYVDTNNNVKFGCLKGCAIRQVWQMRACADGTEAKSGDPTETNR